MESGDSMERDGVWVPVTPGKPSSSRSGPSLTSGVVNNGEKYIYEGFPRKVSFDATEYIERNGVNEIDELTAGVLEEHDVAAKDPKSTAPVQHDSHEEEAVKVPPSECDEQKTPSPSETKNSRKRHNNGFDLNKKPNQRPRVKKHRPKIFDDSKPKKIPTPKTPKTSTPKPKTPKQVHERRNYSRSKSTSCMQTSTGNGHKEDVQAVINTSITDIRSCKKSLNFDFNLVDEESHRISKSHEEPSGSNFEIENFGCFGKVKTSKRNTVRKSRFPMKSLEASLDLLVDDNEQQCHRDVNVVTNQEGDEKHVRKYVNVYQRRKKTSSNTTLQVYQRTFRENQCLQNSKKSGPNFPKMFKKLRLKRKKAAMINYWWCLNRVEDGNSIVKRLHKKKVEEMVNKSKDKKGAVKPNLYTQEYLLRVFSPNRRKRSITHTRMRQNVADFKVMVKDNKKRILQIKKNFLQIKECLPLQEVPVHNIESFTSLHCDVQRADNSDPKWLQLQEVPVFESQSSLTGDQPPTREYCNRLYVRGMMEYLIGKLVNLDINGQCKELVVRDGNKVSKALVKIDPPKKRTMRPKVILDDETLRVWKLLMENDGSEPVEETDNEKEEWWERQRNMFRGRVDSFIAKMHLIQGNRRFSPWKGSVVDSVVGVYLTQNVSDHLSSNAFMSLAARFPLKSTSKEVVDYVDVAASQESVASNTNVDEDLIKKNEMEQDMSTPCADETNATSTTQVLQEVVSNPLVIQESSCVDDTFQKLLDTEDLNYFKNICTFITDDSPLSAPSAIERDMVGEKNDSQFVSQQKSTPEEDSQITAPVSSLESEVTIEQVVQENSCVDGTIDNFRKLLDIEEVNYLKQFCSISTNESPQNEPSVIQMEVIGENNGSESISQQKSNPEEDPKIDAPICSLESEVNVDQVVIDEAKNHESMKPIPLNTGINGKKKSKIPEVKTDWEELRKTYCKSGEKEINPNHMDAIDWDAVRCATAKEIADTIVERGMNNVIAARIKEFLERMVKEHGSTDLEWLRDVPPDQAKEFLLSIQGIGLKSVECVRLLTLHHLAFPVDTNVGRVATRLGWVPLQPLPDAVQLHLLNAYPAMDTIQKYLFPRLCTLDQRTLYELHYQLITFGKVFCTKINPNCNACPMRAECRHYASAIASSRFALTGPTESSNVTSIIPTTTEENQTPFSYESCEPIIEVPPSPEPQVEEETMPVLCDIEDYFREKAHDDDEIPTIRLNTEEFKETLKDTLNENNKIILPEADLSKALVAFTASFRPLPLKFIAKLRTVHSVYELPDNHPCLAGFEEREHDDTTPYLFAIWIPGATPQSLEYTENLTFDSSNINLEDIIKGTVLIPCRTATRGTFPLNGTYFQVNEVFADDETSRNPMDVPRGWLWNLPTRVLACGSSATSIFKALSTDNIQRVFWRGSICVRGFNRQTRKPRPLHRKFHISTTAVAAENKKASKK